MDEHIGLPPPETDTSFQWVDAEEEVGGTSAVGEADSLHKVTEHEQRDRLVQARHGEDFRGDFAFDDREVNLRLEKNNTAYSLIVQAGNSDAVAEAEHFGLRQLQINLPGDPVMGKGGMGNKWFNVSALAILSFYLLKIQDSFMKSQIFDNKYVSETIGMFSEMAKDVKKLELAAAEDAFKREMYQAIGQFVSGGLSLVNVGVQSGFHLRSRQQVKHEMKENKLQNRMGVLKDGDNDYKVDLMTGKQYDGKGKLRTNDQGEPELLKPENMSKQQLETIRDTAGPNQQRLAQSYLNKKSLEGKRPIPEEGAADDPKVLRKQYEYDRELRENETDILKAQGKIKKTDADIKQDSRFTDSKAAGMAYQRSMVITEGVMRALNNFSDGAFRLVSAVYGKEADIKRAKAKYRETAENLVSKWMDRSVEDRKKAHENVNSLYEYIMQMQNELAKLNIGIR